MDKFAEDEIVLPKGGPHSEMRYRGSRIPHAGLFVALIATMLYNQVAMTGPVQAGKSLLGFVIPIMWHLFEVGEPVILGAPSQEVAYGKWLRDLRPIILASQYAKEMPTEGSGSKDGQFEMITFKNGATLTLMSGGGGDEKRSSITSRVLAITEVDKMDGRGGGSEETDKIKQMISRLKANWADRRVYLESTLTHSEGRIFREVNANPATLMLQCPHCSRLVSPERVHLTGWQTAQSKEEAFDNARIICSACGALWDEAMRVAACHLVKLMLPGQSLSADGRLIVGEPVRSDSIGLRFNAVNNLLLSLGAIAVEEWKAAREPDEDSAEREMKQFVWAMPHDPPGLDLTHLTHQTIMLRTQDRAQGVVPDAAELITVGCDVGKYWAYWVALASSETADPYVIDYGTQQIHSKEHGEELAVRAGVNEFIDRCKKGWVRRNGEVLVPKFTFIDSGYQTMSVYHATTAGGAAFLPCKGFGTTQGRKPYQNPGVLKGGLVGDHYHIALQKPENWPLRTPLWLAEVDVDFWKSYLYARLTTPIGQPGALTLFKSEEKNGHNAFCRHLVAERQVQIVLPGKGLVTVWRLPNENTPNHWGDATVYALTAAHLCGVRVLATSAVRAPVPSVPNAPRLYTPDGRPFLVTER